MNFFSDFTVYKMLGILLLLIGALTTFLSGKMTAKAASPYANLIVKAVGLVIVIIGFVLIMFI